MLPHRLQKDKASHNQARKGLNLPLLSGTQMGLINFPSGIMNRHQKLFAAVCLMLFIFNATAVTLYVDLNSPGPTPPYTNWLTAAANIQDAIDAASAGDLVLVTNGIYESGGRPAVNTLLTNRITVTNSLAVRSVNGPATTFILGYRMPGTTNSNGAVRSASLANGASLSGFTLAGGATRPVTDGSSDSAGGGVWYGSQSVVISNCIIAGDAAAYGAGGVYSGTLINCQISSNFVTGGRGWGGGAWNSLIKQSFIGCNVAFSYGGGAYQSTLVQCTVVSNTAMWAGGGTSEGTLNNCLLTGNTAGPAAAPSLGFPPTALLRETAPTKVAEVMAGSFLIAPSRTMLRPTAVVASMAAHRYTTPLPTTILRPPGPILREPRWNIAARPRQCLGILMLPTRLFLLTDQVETFVSNRTLPASIPAGTPTRPALQTSTAIRASLAARWTLARMNFNRLFP